MQKVKWAGLLVAVMFLATMIPVNAVDEDPPEFKYEIMDVLGNVSIVIDYDPELPAGGIPPPGDRRSFVYMTGWYEKVDGVSRLIGIWYRMWMWYDGWDTPHTLNLSGIVSFEIVEGTNKGKYVVPNWYLEAWWRGDESIIPGCIGIGFSWNPNNNRLGYFHCFVDYTEDDEHIRYIDRTFEEDWSTPNWDVNIDRAADFWDLVDVVKHYGETGYCGWIREDVNNDGTVDFWDLVEVVRHYGESW